jgi:hypothetical protein
MGPIRCLETSVKDYHSTLRNIPEERRSQQHRGGSLKSRIADRIKRLLSQEFGIFHGDILRPVAPFRSTPYLERFGITFSMEKSTLRPRHRLICLGLLIDTTAGQITLTRHRLSSWCSAWRWFRKLPRRTCGTSSDTLHRMRVPWVGLCFMPIVFGHGACADVLGTPGRTPGRPTCSEAPAAFCLAVLRCNTKLYDGMRGGYTVRHSGPHVWRL